MRRFVYYNAASVGASFLLDLYPATAAYSVRKLRTGVTNVIRVRRTGDNAERDFSETELNDGTITTWVVAGGGTQNGRVVTWYDQSGNNLHKTQPLGANQTTIVAGGVLNIDNGKPAISRNIGIGGGTVAAWMYAPHTFPTGDILTTNVFVGRRESLTGYAGVNAITPNTPSTDRRCIINSIESTTAFAVRLEGGNTIFTSGNGYNQSLFSVWRDATNTDFKARRNAAPLSVASSGASKNLNIQSNSAFTLFAGGSSGYLSVPANSSDAIAQEIIWWLSDESSNLPAIETNINSYYGIY
jgi:hypothetical protein